MQRIESTIVSFYLGTICHGLDYIHYTLDDITNAIQEGWCLVNVNNGDERLITTVKPVVEQINADLKSLGALVDKEIYTAEGQYPKLEKAWKRVHNTWKITQQLIEPNEVLITHEDWETLYPVIEWSIITMEKLLNTVVWEMRVIYGVISEPQAVH